MTEETIELSPGIIWKVQLIGDRLQIIDEKGRQRHASKGHMMTGIHLAMSLVRTSLRSETNADRALIMAAEQFPEIDESETVA